MIRRFDEPVKPGIRYINRPGAYAILRLGDELLITHQAEPRPEYQLPGGGIDPGETPVAALHREVFEETGWSMSLQKRLGAFLRYTYMPEYDIWARKVCHIYLCRPARKLGPPTEEHHTALWVPIPRALEILANEGDRHFVENLST